MSEASGGLEPLSPRPNRGAAWKIVAAVTVVAGAVGVLLYSSTLSGMEYYKHVDEVMANVESLRGKRLQVHGNVVDGSIERAKGSLQYRFKIETKAPRAAAVIAAEYTGIVPDTFKNGSEVVAKGTLTKDNQLQVVPDGIMAKCPSKYEAQQALPNGETAGVAVPGEAAAGSVAKSAP
jgi:cytochrome c-type biogenesis protein CcmE